MGKWTDTETQVFWGVARWCALFSRTIMADGLLKPHWHRLIEDGHLVEYRTDHGAVVALSRRGHALARDLRPGETFDRLGSASTLAGRAYHNEALLHLQDEGYTPLQAQYKGASSCINATHTSQVLSQQVEVPREELDRLTELWGRGAPTTAHLIGRPLLYAYRHGLNVRRLKALQARHKHDVDRWRHPLIIAVPDEGELRPYVRAHLHEERLRLDRQFGVGMLHGRAHRYSDIRVLIVPVHGQERRQQGVSPRGSASS